MSPVSTPYLDVIYPIHFSSQVMSNLIQTGGGLKKSIGERIVAWNVIVPYTGLHTLELFSGQSTVLQATNYVLGWVFLHSTGPNCARPVSDAVKRLILLIDQLHAVGISLGLEAAVLGYTIAGLLWLSGVPGWQRSARRVFVSVSGGLIVVLLAGPFVEMIRGPLCGGPP